MQENPNRSDGSDTDVDDRDHEPRRHGELQRAEVTNGHTTQHRGNAQHRHDAQWELVAIKTDTENDSQEDKEHGARTGSRCGCKGRCHDVSEGSHNDQERHPSEQGKEDLASTAQDGFNDLTDRLTAMANGSDQRTVVLHATEEDGTDDDPQNDRDPTEDGGRDRTHDGAGTGDGTKMVTQKHGRLRRHIVNAVIHFTSRRFASGVNAPFLGKPSTVSYIRNHKYHCRDNE